MGIKGMIFNFVQENPLTCIRICVAGVLNMYVVELLTSDQTIKLLSVLGATVGLTAGVLTIIVKNIERKKLLKELKNLNKEHGVTI